jgi:hypothetical protein
MRHGEDARAEELGHLKLALATFALQLDAFEMRARGALLTVGRPHNSVAHPDSGREPRRDDVSGGQ